MEDGYKAFISFYSARISARFQRAARAFTYRRRRERDASSLIPSRRVSSFPVLFPEFSRLQLEFSANRARKCHLRTCLCARVHTPARVANGCTTDGGTTTRCDDTVRLFPWLRWREPGPYGLVQPPFGAARRCGGAREGSSRKGTGRRRIKSLKGLYLPCTRPFSHPPASLPPSFSLPHFVLPLSHVL